MALLMNLSKAQILLTTSKTKWKKGNSQRVIMAIGTVH